MRSRFTPPGFKQLGIAVLMFAAVIQFLPFDGAQNNPASVTEPAWDSPRTRALAVRACFDCHSNQTRWPAYARLAPASWLIEYDVNKGRAELNFSEWDRPQEEATNAAAAVREREMPPLAYRVMHRGARLTMEERNALARGLFATLSEPPRDPRVMTGR
jgi:mono/diheme cytochrome c family protein